MFIHVVGAVEIWYKFILYICGSSGKKRTRDLCSRLTCNKWSCWLRWRVWLTILLIICYLVVSVLWLSLLTYVFIDYDPFSPFKSWYVASFFVIGTFAMLLISLRQHWVHYTKPYLQRYIIRINYFIFSYGFYSWLSLRYPKGSVYFNALRELQEAYVLYCFTAYLANYLIAQHYPKLKDILAQQPPARLCICCLCFKCSTPRYFVTMCKVGVLQYSVVRTILTVITVITEAAGVYGDGELSPAKASMYVQVANAISQIVAMVFLIVFYRGTKDLLKPISPVFKFAVIKSTIFITSFQGFFINLLAKVNAVKPSETWVDYGFSKDSDAIPTPGIQNFMITIEMFLSSIVVFFVFSYKPFVHCPLDGDVPLVSYCIRAFQESDSEHKLMLDRAGSRSSIDCDLTYNSVSTSDAANDELVTAGAIPLMSILVMRNDNCVPY